MSWEDDAAGMIRVSAEFCLHLKDYSGREHRRFCGKFDKNTLGGAKIYPARS